MNTYAMRVLELDSLVKKLVLRSLGVDKYVDSLAKSVKYSLRAMRYAAPATEESMKPETSCHRDANFVTILHQNHVNGLEVQTKDGCWIEVAFSSASSFVVITGESFYVSPPHPPLSIEFGSKECRHHDFAYQLRSIVYISSINHHVQQ